MRGSSAERRPKRTSASASTQTIADAGNQSSPCGELTILILCLAMDFDRRTRRRDKLEHSTRRTPTSRASSVPSTYSQRSIEAFHASAVLRNSSASFVSRFSSACSAAISSAAIVVASVYGVSPRFLFPAVLEARTDHWRRCKPRRRESSARAARNHWSERRPRRRPRSNSRSGAATSSS